MESSVQLQNSCFPTPPSPSPSPSSAHLSTQLCELIEENLRVKEVVNMIFVYLPQDVWIELLSLLDRSNTLYYFTDGSSPHRASTLDYMSSDIVPPLYRRSPEQWGLFCQGLNKQYENLSRLRDTHLLQKRALWPTCVLWDCCQDPPESNQCKSPPLYIYNVRNVSLPSVQLPSRQK